MSKTPLTLRIEADTILISGDDGETWQPNPPEAAELRSSVSNILEVAQLLEPGSPTAVLQGSLGEAEKARPRKCIETVETVIEDASGSVKVPLGENLLESSQSLKRILDVRQSERDLRPLNFSELATVLVRTGRVRAWEDLPNGGQRETRAMPSAGACHPVELQVVTSGIPGLTSGLWQFDPIECVLRRQDETEDLVGKVKRNLESRGFCLPGGFTAIFVVAEFAKALNRYPAGSTLVWRDAGVVLGGLHLCAADIGLASCIVATCGLLGRQKSQVDVGAIAVGRSPEGLASS